MKYECPGNLMYKKKWVSAPCGKVYAKSWHIGRKGWICFECFKQAIGAERFRRVGPTAHPHPQFNSGQLHQIGDIMTEATHQEVMAYADQHLGKKINFGHLAQLTKAYKLPFILSMMKKAVSENVQKVPEARRIQYVTTLCKKFASQNDYIIHKKICYGRLPVNKKDN